MWPEIDLEMLQTPEATYAAIALVAVALLGVLLGLMRGRSRPQFLVGLEEHESQIRELKKAQQVLRAENRDLSTFLIVLPDLVRQLNSNTETRKIPPLLLTVVEQLFDAQQILIFHASRDGRNLILVAGKGLPSRSPEQEVVPFGVGRIGWVAQHQITMDAADFKQKSQVARGELNLDAHPMFRPDICAPMLAKTQTLGVISVGGLTRRPKNEKNMLKMVADMGSIAMQNTLLFTRIQESANSDGLTGLANKRHFMAKLADEIIRAQKAQRNLSLFLFDIDHFKVYNDTNGHLAGDEALRITGRLIKESIRQDDMAARYGGEEFVLLLPNTDKQGALLVAEKIRSMIEKYPYPQESSQPSGRVSISGGVATFPYDAASAADLIRCADQALYEGKKAGRNRVLKFEPTYFSETGADTEFLADSQKI